MDCMDCMRKQLKESCRNLSDLGQRALRCWGKEVATGRWHHMGAPPEPSIPNGFDEATPVARHGSRSPDLERQCNRLHCESTARESCRQPTTFESIFPAGSS